MSAATYADALRKEAEDIIALVESRNEAHGSLESRSPEYKGSALILKASRLSDVGRRLVIDAPHGITLTEKEADTLRDTVAYCLEVLREHNKLPF
ncbi:MAG TPA: hypothetical protein PKZ78_09735 [Candidatus Goldiibacteriota bacterium]|mgnify:CR=1 FL=1|jgi:hypothetical protein|nr:hypothetical protein [Candidatus Goldiibacteriota bacterium]